MANPTYTPLLTSLREQNQLSLLGHIQRGIEKEGLRCEPNGHLSQAPHPQTLGSALTHPSITTDYSESLLEFITPVFDNAKDTLKFMHNLHQYSYQNIGDELIWPASMPCLINGEESIPIAQYGYSNLGQLKHAYRHGLWHRYGRTMQAIAGIHYNFSMPDALWPLMYQEEKQAIASAEQLKDFISTKYFGLIRNFRRNSWILSYLFGASPAVCSSFLDGQEHGLDTFKEHTLYLPYATSLRMSDLGYQNNAQAELIVCYNSIENYVDTLSKAVTQPVAAYEEIGLQEEGGQYKQLNTSLLQIENEYYSDIRPKRIGNGDEKPLQALANHGVEYIEVRCTDINPFLTLGMDETHIHFLDVFLTHCLFSDSPDISNGEYAEIKANQHDSVMQGRDAKLNLSKNGESIGLRRWGNELLTELTSLAQSMDEATGNSQYSDALAQQQAKLDDDSLTPSAQYLAEMKTKDLEFSQLTLKLAEQRAAEFKQPLDEELNKEMQLQAQQSLMQQAEIEAGDQIDFPSFLKQYLTR
ncbi:MAG: glutamate--cysteine ligase [Oleispira sp.]